jgi:hypothetical protein
MLVTPLWDSAGGLVDDGRDRPLHIAVAIDGMDGDVLIAIGQREANEKVPSGRSFTGLPWTVRRASGSVAP